MSVLRCVPNDDDEGESELLWVKAGEPGQKPTIIRQIRSESSTSSSSRDNSGGSTGNRKNLLTVENGTVFRTMDTAGTRVDTSSNSLTNLLGRTSNNDSHVIVVNISEQIYPADVDRERIQRWRDLHSPCIGKKLLVTDDNIINNNEYNTKKNDRLKRPSSQPIRTISNTSSKIEHCIPNSNTSPNIERRQSSSSPFNRVLKNDEGYTSLSEDCKDSDNESVRSRSLPSSWRPTYLNNKRQEKSMLEYAKRMTSNADADVNFMPCSENASNRLEQNNSHKKRNHSIRHHTENAIEICTCFVCLRSAIYHTQDEDDTDSLVEHPCSCDAPSMSCCGRWCAIGVLIVFLPLLIFYPPLKCCISLHEYRKKKIRKKKEKKLLKMKRTTEPRTNIL